MIFFERLQYLKVGMVLVAIFIAIVSLLTSNYLISDLENEETKKMEVWAEAMRSLDTADEFTDLNLVLKVINENNTIPIIVTDEDGEIMSTRNIDKSFSQSDDSISYLKDLASRFKANGRFIKIDVPDEFEDSSLLICYDESIMLRRLYVYPYIQLGVVIIFVLIAIFALFATMRAEQDKVWVGLSKETAHQLGTPISSLLAWQEMLKESYPDDVLLPEMDKDIKRLERIAERFSKIGSIPEPRPEDLLQVLSRVIVYMDKRTSNKIKISTHFPEEPIIINLISSLFEWVAENLCKNAVDAMSGSGSIDVFVGEDGDMVYVEFKDTGKGISKTKFNSVFKPGFTTKERGWGLGLSLAKRIVEEYHKGKIFVKESEIGIGTTFRVELPK